MGPSCRSPRSWRSPAHPPKAQFGAHCILGAKAARTPTPGWRARWRVLACTAPVCASPCLMINQLASCVVLCMGLHVVCLDVFLTPPCTPLPLPLPLVGGRAGLRVVCGGDQDRSAGQGRRGAAAGQGQAHPGAGQGHGRHEGGWAGPGRSGRNGEGEGGNVCCSAPGVWGRVGCGEGIQQPLPPPPPPPPPRRSLEAPRHRQPCPTPILAPNTAQRGNAFCGRAPWLSGLALRPPSLECAAPSQHARRHPAPTTPARVCACLLHRICVCVRVSRQPPARS